MHLPLMMALLGSPAQAQDVLERECPYGQLRTEATEDTCCSLRQTREGGPLCRSPGVSRRLEHRGRALHLRATLKPADGTIELEYGSDRIVADGTLCDMDADYGIDAVPPGTWTIADDGTTSAEVVVP